MLYNHIGKPHEYVCLSRIFSFSAHVNNKKVALINQSFTARLQQIPECLPHLQRINHSLHQTLWAKKNILIVTQQTDCETEKGRRRSSHPVGVTT